MEIINLKDIHPAEYNPRYLSDESRHYLEESISTIGILKPILINAGNNTIIAGHQRTECMLKKGISETYGYRLHSLSKGDEMRLNQIHNATEIEVSPKAPKLRVSIPIQSSRKIVLINHQHVECIDVGDMKIQTSMLAKMILRYGHFGTPIVTTDGEIIVSSCYAYACVMLKKDFECYIVDSGKKDVVLGFFRRKYGVFNYDMLKKKTYIQCLAQINRLSTGRHRESNTYKKMLAYFETLTDKGKNLSILDFGAGKYEYAMLLESQGFNIDYVDPYHRVKNTNIIDFSNNLLKFKHIIDNVKKGLLYDVVICDSVLNSVDSIKAHNSVINTCRALCKPGGVIFISGRSKEKDDILKSYVNSVADKDKNLRFFDENNFTAQYRDGEWFYQKFHNEKQINDIGLMISGCNSGYKVTYVSQCFQIQAQNINKINDDEAVEALIFEFNMILPNGKSYGLGEEAKRAYLTLSQTQSWLGEGQARDRR